MSIRSSAPIVSKAAASAGSGIRSASALARTRTFSASASAGLTTSPPAALTQLGLALGSSAWALMTPIWVCGLA